MRKVLNFVRPGEEILSSLPMDSTFSKSIFSLIVSDQPQKCADLLIISFSDFHRFTNAQELRYIPAILYGSGDLIDRAFSIGASDFIKDPFSFQELEARAARILSEKKFEFEGMTFEFFQTGIACRGRRQSLSDREYQLLSQLFANSGNIVSRRGILYRLGLGEDSSRSLDVYINSLRRKIGILTGSREAGRSFICTVRGKGYTLNSQVICG